MQKTREFLQGLGLPPGDLYELPTSAKRFPDGAQYRVEIPSVEGPRALAAVLEEAGNLRFKTVGEATGFMDPAAYDFHLKAGSPCIDRGVDPGVLGEVSLRPEFQYVHPCDRMKRPDDGKIDIGAFEYAPVDEGEGAAGTHPRGVDPATRHGTGHGRRALGAA